ncbi:HigA family addiction module antidote protein [Magnetovirga frankeli]|uniref:HigA family addiction module antitoxin n=1 Tax=Magnetovirga frankeli TaxID=947516 RepID=UPI001293E1E6|nr:HigA family addiction module antidote protein [gamma proteobacterium SS-5]
MNGIYHPAHPGEVLKDGWPDEVTITAAARQLGVTRAALSRILNGHAAISADMALRLQDWLGISAQMWLRMQAAYDLSQAERNKNRPPIERFKQAS